MILIDGSIGEGGGQILRTALGLSMVTGLPFRIQNLRARREKPGLLRQHLTAVNAAATLCAANVDGAAIGSREISFTPGKVSAGEYAFSVGSAGSTTLVFQTILPALLMADGPSTITLEGGTHNPFAPPIDFLAKAFLPLVERMGAHVSIKLERAGFYPAGGGRFIAAIQPTGQLRPIYIPQRGEIRRRLGRAVFSGLPDDIAKRELKTVESILGWSAEELRIEPLPSEWGPGNLLMLEIESEHLTEVFTGFGMKQVSAEFVARQAAEEARRYLTADAPVGEHLADQLLLPMALAGAGSFTTQPPTEHSRTNIQVIQSFLPIRIGMKAIDHDVWQVEVNPAR